MHVAIVCACLPAINQLFRLLFGSKEGTTGKSYGSSKASSGKQSASAGPPSQTYSHRPPKRGDESDFMPLVDYNGSKVSDKGSAYSVNVASKGDSMA